MDKPIDDAVFALILRFAGFDHKLSFNDDEFLREQLKEINAHIDQFPPAERREQTLRWIEKYASGYRDAWNKEVVAREVSEHRCPDCPLCDGDDHEHCEIHDQWLVLLQKYIAHEVNSQEYIGETLTLLSSHKEDLKIKLSTLSSQS